MSCHLRFLYVYPLPMLYHVTSARVQTGYICLLPRVYSLVYQSNNYQFMSLAITSRSFARLLAGQYRTCNYLESGDRLL